MKSAIDKLGGVQMAAKTTFGVKVAITVSSQICESPLYFFSLNLNAISPLNINMHKKTSALILKG